MSPLQWRHMAVMAPQIADNVTVRSTDFGANNKEIAKAQYNQWTSLALLAPCEGSPSTAVESLHKGPVSWLQFSCTHRQTKHKIMIHDRYPSMHEWKPVLFWYSSLTDLILAVHFWRNSINICHSNSVDPSCMANAASVYFVGKCYWTVWYSWVTRARIYHTFWKQWLTVAFIKRLIFCTRHFPMHLKKKMITFWKKKNVELTVSHYNLKHLIKVAPK